jgi:hypothetical protein
MILLSYMVNPNSREHISFSPLTLITRWVASLDDPYPRAFDGVGGRSRLHVHGSDCSGTS